MIVNLWRHADAVSRLAYMHKAKPKLNETFALVGTNSSASSLPLLAQAFRSTTQRRPEVRRPFLHLVVAAAPQGFDLQTWHRLARRLLHLLGLPSSRHVYYAGLHRSRLRQHCHILVSRVAVDGSVWYGQHERRRAIEAAKVLGQEYSPGWPYGDQISEHPNVVLMNRVMQQEKLALIDPRQVVEKLIDCLKEDCCTASDFICAASRHGIELEVRSDHSGQVKGLCLVLPTKLRHRLALSHVTSGLFSWKSLKDFYDEGSGRLFDHYRQTMMLDTEQADRLFGDSDFDSHDPYDHRPGEAPDDGVQNAHELPQDEDSLDREHIVDGPEMG